MSLRILDTLYYYFRVRFVDATFIVFNNELLLQVDCESDALLAADVSSSGELLAFGDSGGYVHVWGASEHALVNIQSLPTEVSLELSKLTPT